MKLGIDLRSSVCGLGRELRCLGEAAVALARSRVNEMIYPELQHASQVDGTVQTQFGALSKYPAAAACQRAWQDGRAWVTTDHLLAAFVRRIDPFGMTLDGLGRRLRERLRAGTLGGESKGSHEAEPLSADVDFEVSAFLREAEWVARGRLGLGLAAAAPAWSPDVRSVVAKAQLLAKSLEVRHVHWVHIAWSLLNEPTGPTAEILADLGSSVRRVQQAMPREHPLSRGDEPAGVAANMLYLSGALTKPISRRMRWGYAVLAWPGRVPIVRRAVQAEACRQAIRWGSPQVHQLHLLVGVIETHQELRDRGWHLREDLARYSNAGKLALDHGVAYSDLARRAAAGRFGVGDSDRGKHWRRSRQDPSIGVDAAAATRKAARLSRDLGQNCLGTSHVLLALLQDPAGDCSRLLEEHGVSVASLRFALEQDLADT
jgi:hypothetical protein